MFYENNSWLYEIICNEDRTAFYTRKKNYIK